MSVYGQMTVPIRATRGGGALPTREQQLEPNEGGAGVSGRLSDTGAEIAGQAAKASAQGGEMVANAVGNIAKPFKQIAGAALAYIDADQARRDLDATNAFLAYQRKMQEVQDVEAQKAGREARGGLERVMSAGSKYSASIAKDFGLSGRQANWFNWKVHQDQGQRNSWAEAHSYKQLGVEYKATLEDAEKVAVNAVAANPDSIAQHSANLLYLLEQYNAYATGMPGDRDANKMAIADRLASGAITTALGNGDANRANELFARFSPLLSEVKKGELNNSIAAALTKDLASRAELGEAVALPSGSASTAHGVSPSIGGSEYNAAAWSRFQEKKGTPFKMGSTDCSGWVRDVAGATGLKGFTSGNAEDLVVKAMNQRRVSLDELKNNPREGLIIGVVNGAEHAKNRRLKIGHVAITMRGPDGKIYVTENSTNSSKRPDGNGVRAIPVEEWIAGRERVGHGIQYIGDALAGQTATHGVRGGTQASSLTKNTNTAVSYNNPSGLTDPNNPGHYRKFGSLEEAFPAYIRQMKLYQSRGLQTWEQILKKWANLDPEKHPEDKTYLPVINSISGVDMSAKAHLDNLDEVSRVLAAQARRENGVNISPQQVAAMLAGRGGTAPVSTQYGQTRQPLVPTQFGGGVTLSAAQMADINAATRKGQIVGAKRSAIEFFSSDPNAILKMTPQQVGDVVGATTTEGMWAAYETAWGLYGQTEHARLTQERAALRTAWESDVEPIVRGGDFFAAHDRIDTLNVSEDVKQDLHTKVDRFQTGALAKTYRRNSRDLYASIMAFEGNEAELQQKIQDAFDNDNIGLSEYQRAMSLVKNRYSPYAKALKDFVTQSTALMKDPSILDAQGFGVEFFRESFEKAVDTFNRLSADEKKIEMRDIREGLRDPKARSKSLVLSMLDGDIASYKDAQTRQALMAQWDAKKREEAANQHEAEVRNAIRFLRTGQGTPPSPAVREEAKERMEREARQARQEAARAKQEARAKEQATVTPEQLGEQERRAARARGEKRRTERRASFLEGDISSEEVSAAAEAIGGAVSLGERAARPVRKAIAPPAMWLRRNVDNSVKAIMDELSREAQGGE